MKSYDKYCTGPTKQAGENETKYIHEKTTLILLELLFTAWWHCYIFYENNMTVNDVLYKSSK